MNKKIINNAYSQLTAIVNDTYEKMADNVLVSNDYGVVVFNNYLISETNNGYDVLSRTRSDILSFSNSKNALIWSILDYHVKIVESKRVKELDGFLYGIEIDRKIHSKLKMKGGTENYLIQSSKLQRDTDRYRQFIFEMSAYEKMAKSLMAINVKRVNGV